MDLNKEIKVVLSYESSKSRWRNNQASKEWKRANKVSIAVMGEGLQRKKNCGCIEDLFIMLKTLSGERINQKQLQIMSNFKLVEGKMIGLNGTYYTNANLTDEKAIEILTKFPKHIVTFGKYPDNWRELCGKPAAVNGGAKSEDVPTGRAAELLAMDKDELKARANGLAGEIEGLKKIHHAAGIPKLVAYIMENEDPIEEAE